MALRKDLIGKRVYLDTNVIVYALEGPRPLSLGQSALFEAIDEGAVTALTSALTLAECLAWPLSTRDLDLASLYERFLADRPSFELVSVDRQILIAAAHIRVLTNQKLPDAIHIATAAQRGADFFLTGDRKIKVSGFQLTRWSSL